MSRQTGEMRKLRRVELFCLFSSIPLLMFLLLFLQGIGDFGLALPNGYELSRISGGTFQITSPSRDILVDPRVVEYAVTNHWVVGRAEYYSDQPGSVASYFAIDTRSGITQKGLQEDQFLTVLQQEKIGMPSLRKPPATMLITIIQGRGDELR